MFVTFLHYTDTADEAGAHMESHLAWVNEGFEAGVFLVVGLVDGGGGMIVANEASRADLDARLQREPLLRHGIVTHETRTVEVKNAIPDLEFLVDGS